ncbi:MAG: hypothetical protein HKM23_00030 [Nitrosopumilus sp.]|nr:hypothetical protein [Nitrosopumilus sp.]
MNKFLFLMPLLLGTGVGVAYAEPLDDVRTEILDFNGSSATIQVSWNQEDMVSQYEIGCVSCFPNISKVTTENNIILNEVTPIGEKSIALLYVIAYDSESEIIKANQIFVELK